MSGRYGADPARIVQNNRTCSLSNHHYYHKLYFLALIKLLRKIDTNNITPGIVKVHSIVTRNVYGLNGGTEILLARYRKTYSDFLRYHIHRAYESIYRYLSIISHSISEDRDDYWQNMLYIPVELADTLSDILNRYTTFAHSDLTPDEILRSFSGFRSALKLHIKDGVEYCDGKYPKYVAVPDFGNKLYEAMDIVSNIPEFRNPIDKGYFPEILDMLEVFLLMTTSFEGMYLMKSFKREIRSSDRCGYSFEKYITNETMLCTVPFYTSHVRLFSENSSHSLSKESILLFIVTKTILRKMRERADGGPSDNSYY